MFQALSKYGITPEQQLAIGRFLSDPSSGGQILRVLDEIHEGTGREILEGFDGHAASTEKRTPEEIIRAIDSAYDERRAAEYAREFLRLFVQAPSGPA